MPSKRRLFKDRRDGRVAPCRQRVVLLKRRPTDDEKFWENLRIMDLLILGCDPMELPVASPWVYIFLVY